MAPLDFRPVWQNLGVLLAGARLGATVAVAGFGLAIVAGLIIALLRRSRIAPLRWLAFAYVQFFRGIALYVLILWLYFGIAVAAGITLGALTAGILTLALLNSAYLAEVFRSGIEAVDRGQREAALAMGLTPRQAFRDVVAPQALRVVVPATGNHFVDAIKDSAILSVIAVPELMRQATSLAQVTARPFEFYTAAAVLYLVVVVCVSSGLRWLERRLDYTRGLPWSRGTAVADTTPTH